MGDKPIDIREREMKRLARQITGQLVCDCGHERGNHAEEPPYSCDVEECTCCGFTWPSPASGAAAQPISDDRLREVLNDWCEDKDYTLTDVRRDLALAAPATGDRSGKMKPIVRLYLSCPACGTHEFRVDHLKIGDKPGSWHCDECGYYSLVAVGEGPTYSIALTGERAFPITVTLQTATEPPVIFKLNAWKYAHSASDSPEEFVEHQRYFYEEHTCPTNCLPSTEQIVFQNEADPHGLFKLLKIEVGHIDHNGNKEHEAVRAALEAAAVEPR